MKILVMVAVLCVVMFGCSSAMQYFGMREDNNVEEAIEAYIFHETGVDIDFSEQTPE